MQQNDFIKALGFESIIKDKRKMDKVLRLASFEPDFLYERKIDKKGRTYFDRYKYLGSGFGVSVQGYRHIKLNKEGQKIEKHVVMGWDVFAQGHRDNDVSHAFIDTDNEQAAFCFVEDDGSGNAFEFRVNNSLEMIDRYQAMPNYNAVEAFEANIPKVNAAMLLVFATILLPVVKNETAASFRAQQDAMQRELMDRARKGDIEAEENLYEIAKKREIDLRERLAHEDLLSVFEGYFLNLIEQSGIFSVLADILEVDQLTNEASDEKLYRLSVSVTGIKMTMYVNAEDVVGMPMEGMRIMGMGMLQGTVLVS
ncbi:MAG: DUF3881 family protein [Defluviitaleaceae bacterium]|nr:DUF3881 family protein [Defluviitaleaceae bacterium]